MSSETKFVDSLIKRVQLSIHTMAPARVINFYESTQEADIEVLFMSADKGGNVAKYPLIPRVPVLGMRFKTKAGSTLSDELEYIPFLKKNDVVFVGFAERAMDNLQKVPFDPQFRRTHDLRDAVILGMFGGAL